MPSVAPPDSSTSVNMSAFLRPQRSPSQPKRMPPMTEPASVMPTTSPTCGSEMSMVFWMTGIRNASTIRL